TLMTCSTQGTLWPTILDVDTTWTKAGSPHHITGVTLMNGAQLTIEAGALVCVGTAGSIQVAADVSDARLDVQGSLIEPVVFRDEPDGTAWNGILVFPTANPTVQCSIVGAQIVNGRIQASGNVAIDHTRIEHGAPVVLGLNGGRYSINHSSVLGAMGGLGLELYGPPTGPIDGLRVAGGTGTGMIVYAD